MAQTVTRKTAKKTAAKRRGKRDQRRERLPVSAVRVRAAALAHDFEGERGQALDDTREFLEQMVARGFLEELADLCDLMVAYNCPKTFCQLPKLLPNKPK